MQKRYELLTDKSVPFKDLEVRSAMVRVGEKYQARPPFAGGELAETVFTRLSSTEGNTRLMAEPRTGKTHQIRAQAADRGFPICGDRLYGGTPGPRLCLHAAELGFAHPVSGATLLFKAPHDFTETSRELLRRAVIATGETDCFRLLHGAADEAPGWYLDRVGDFLLSQSDGPLREEQFETLPELMARWSTRGVYHKILSRRVHRLANEAGSPEWMFGDRCPDKFIGRENGMAFQFRFTDGYSIGLFLDQRENRRRLLNGYVATGFEMGGTAPSSRPPLAGLSVLNTFAYTCAFSACAAAAGAQVTSIDLSRKYLEWGRENFRANQIEDQAHEFLHGEVFDWLRRFEKKKRRFDLVILDPPTFSQSKQSGAFRVEADYAKLLRAAVGVLTQDGVLLCCTNAATLSAEEFQRMIRLALEQSKRKILQEHFAPQPPDFPANRSEPAHLKTFWLRVR